ncbi:CDP-alcohol phosphatidyltransferase family protein [Agrobacterium sp. a22-2]|uniref:CDP-alcohol phosphatidyltransferase family protein n=1 Tax=Agrobacterium sp. a22-2 TaxID=2283840 RepID=UPI001447CA28|nr:CDP-alcohol phosphatidyltransferase family protein [Agrobacterium sp. a22-2]NKN38939.1 CDP-alcohol phosphatidyltransferase family protein [Agrobacterium sp. a22-2]
MSSKESPVLQAVAVDSAPSLALKASALMVLGCVFATAVVGYVLADMHWSLGRNAVIAAAILLLVIFSLVVHGLPHHGFERFGLANTVTAVRAALVSLVFAMIFFPGAMQHAQTMTWALVLLVLMALALDGVDGYLARRFGQESALGARFDMEIDALLILCLSAAAFLLGKADLWVLLIGLMRYGFVLAQHPLPRLKAPLPPSFRRKLVCVVQVAVLCLVLVPVVVPPLSSWLAAMALVLLCYSFAVDCLYLLRKTGATE